MKKAFLILGVVAVSAAAGGFTAWKVAAPREGSVQYIEREVERTPALGTHFTSYQAEQYPDLTYAAENAVKAVVNIEAVQQVEMPRRRGYDPFLEFFGIPQGYDEGPQFREQRAGGSASEAGIRKGDVILDIDGVKINDNATLSEQIGRRRPNDKVKLSVKRDGKVKQIDVTLRNKAGKTELITKEDVDMVEVLGGKFADAGAKLCRELDIKGGVQVVGIKADGILARARVKQGFVITHINDRPVYSLGDMQRMTEKVRSIDGVYPNGRSASYTLVE